MLLSIIITHYHTPIMLKLCLKTIAENLHDIEHEIYVADSEANSEDQLFLKDLFPGVNFISFEKNVGYAKLVNSGLERSKGDYILILNADIFISKESVSDLISFLSEHPRVGIAGPSLLSFNGKKQNSCFRFPTVGAILARRTFIGKTKWGKKKLDDFLYKDKDLNAQQDVDWIQGSALLAKKEAIEKVGPFDERFFMYLEDTDWCRRFRENNFRVVYLPKARMHHYYYRNSKKWGGFLDIFLNKYTRIHLMSTAKYLLKYR